ncbi:electron transport complex protein RnfB [Tangfeifania diversioriginum]|uniref:Electron transport complex protein RnfB n=1 Tax=Tangfeifania diversioriginum TaxID=1168035 RepID=A0A1M6P326_9BACT|nr:ferredoxin [Tangfeifania diversioriginum]SHK02375.1 electron transport complex protein RnfB [Tangfeifania diversioriginum]
MEKESKSKNRREFIQSGARLTLALALGSVSGLALSKVVKDDYVWQIDPFECTQCGRCATDCVMTPSAVKCVHAYDLCGYCDLCGGYFKPDANQLSTAAENQLCPTAAIERKFIEEPYFEYIINEDLCIGCAKCVEGCTSFGNGSLHLQIIHDICLNCNECSIARVCPSDAIKRVPASEAYNVKGDFSKKPES